MQTCIQAGRHPDIQTHIHTCLPTDMLTYLPTYMMRSCMHKYIHTYVRTCMYVYACVYPKHKITYTWHSTTHTLYCRYIHIHLHVCMQIGTIRESELRLEKLLGLHSAAVEGARVQCAASRSLRWGLWLSIGSKHLKALQSLSLDPQNP